MVEWKSYKLCDFLEQYRITHIVKDNVEYGQITISNSNTVSFREKKIGKTIGRKRQFVIDLQKYPHTLIFTRQGVSGGSIGLAPFEVDGCIATENMPMFSVDTSKIIPDILKYFLLTENFKNEVRKLTPTGSAQKAIHERELLKLEFLFPKKIEHQQETVATIQRFRKILETLITSIREDSNYLSKLRQAILQEAIEGKLTADWRKKHPVKKGDPNADAAALLEQIKAEKQNLIAAGKLKNQKPLAPIKPDEIPFELPEGWVWSRLPQILDRGNSLRRGPFGSSITKAMFVPKSENTTKVYEQKNAIYKDYSLGSYFINLNEHPNLVGFMAGKGDIIISCAGTIGETYLLPDDAPNGIINQALLKLRLNLLAVNCRFFMIVFKAQTQTRINNDAKGSAMKNIGSVNYLKNELMFPLPPLAEQKAIVERVDRLLAMVDDLEQQVKTRQQQAEQLMQSVLREAFDQN